MRRFLTAAMAVLLIALAAPVGAADPAAVEQKGASVMPFDQNRTMHMFQPTPTGGTMMIMSTDEDATQIALVQSHLQHEATAFRQGDYADPAAIHGADMPGLSTLEAKAGVIHITYQAMPMGAEIVFATDDPAALQALHGWFDAQLHDHGTHAMSMPMNMN